VVVLVGPKRRGEPGGGGGGQGGARLRLKTVSSPALARRHTRHGVGPLRRGPTPLPDRCFPSLSASVAAAATAGSASAAAAVVQRRWR